MRIALLAGICLVTALVAPIALAAQSDAQKSRAQIAAEREATLAKRLVGYTRAGTMNCVPMRPTLETQKITGTAVVYGRGRTLYVNRLGGDCNGLRPETIMITRTTIGQFCRGDIVTFVDNASTIPRGSCGFGDFERYERADDQRR